MKSIRLTALHEAAHAVACIVYGVEFCEISIIATDDYNGCILYKFDNKEIFDNIQGFSDTIEPENLDKFVMARIIVSLAGYEAELKVGFENSLGAQTDFSNVTDISLCHYGSDAQLYVDSAVVATKSFINQHWDIIELVADALLNEKKLPYEEVFKIVEPHLQTNITSIIAVPKVIIPDDL